MTPELTLLRAAQLLEADAEILKRSHTVAGGTWPDHPEDQVAKRDYDERMSIAAKLVLLANPFA